MRTIYEIKREIQNYNEQAKKLYEENIELALANDAEGIKRNKNELKTVEMSLNVLKEELERREKESIKKLELVNGCEDPTENRGIMYRSLLKGEQIPDGVYRSLFGNTNNPNNGGSNLLPTSLGESLIFDSIKNNPIRDIASITNIVGLELPRISYAIDDMDFVVDGELAKELNLKGEKVKFNSFGFRISTEVSDSLLEGTNTNLVEYIEKALREGLAKKEKYSIFKTTKAEEKHMNIYSDINGIKKVQGENLFDAITNALADLDEEFYTNATIVMRKNDYFSIIKELSNQSKELFQLQPNEILGTKVVFCEQADKPIIGDFSYLHINYSSDIKLESERTAREGRNYFVLSGNFDIRLLLTSAFRIVEVTQGVSRSTKKDN